MINMWNVDNSQYFTFAETAPENPLFIEMAGDEFVASNYYIRRDKAAVNVVCYVVTGIGTVRTKGREVTAAAGDLFVLEELEFQEYFVDPDRPWHVLWFNIVGPLLPALLHSYHLDSQILYPNVGKAVARYFYDAMDICRSEQDTVSKQQEMSSIVFRILLSLSRANIQTEQSYSNQMQMILDYLEKSIYSEQSTKLNYAEMGRALLLSPRQITRIFYLEMKCSPYTYYSGLRLEKARKYLESTTLSVKEISERLDYCDASYFSNAFKHRFGVSPNQCRKG